MKKTLLLSLFLLPLCFKNLSAAEVEMSEISQRRLSGQSISVDIPQPTTISIKGLDKNKVIDIVTREITYSLQTNMRIKPCEIGMTNNVIKSVNGQKANFDFSGNEFDLETIKSAFPKIDTDSIITQINTLLLQQQENKLSHRLSRIFAKSISKFPPLIPPTDPSTPLASVEPSSGPEAKTDTTPPSTPVSRDPSMASTSTATSLDGLCKERNGERKEKKHMECCTIQ